MTSYKTCGHSNLPKFQCVQCGKCCSHIRGKMSREEYELIHKIGYGNMPLVQLVLPEKLSFPIWPDEARQLKKKAEELKKSGFEAEVRIIPLRAVFDLNTNTTIIITYLFDHEDCPFQVFDKSETVQFDKSEIVHSTYNNNAQPNNNNPQLNNNNIQLNNNNTQSNHCAKCLAYDSRTLICKQFPFQTPNEIIEWCTGIQNLQKELEVIGKNTAALTEPEKKEIFGPAYEAALTMNARMAEQNSKILELVRNKKIRPAINYPYKFLIKRIEKSRQVDFDEFEKI